MATIVTRAGKGSALTHAEVDANFNNLNNDKIEAAQTVTLTNKTLSTGTAITAGTINNATIGASTPSSGAFTTLSATGVTTVQAGTVSAPAITTSGDTNTGIYFPAADTVAIGTGGTERLRVDSAGNLGLGVTPSAWSGFSAFDIGAGGSVASNSASNIRLTQNCYYNGTNWIYKATQAASRYEAAIGAHQWYTAPSGTAGNTITFTQAMTLDASGNLGIGTTSPALPIDVVSNSSALALSIRGRSSDDIGTLMYYTNNGVTNTAQIQMRPNDNEFRFAALGARSQTFYTNGSERMRIDSSGNVGIGTSSPSNKIESIGATPAYFGETTTNGTRFGYASALPSNSPNCFVGWVPDTVGGINGDLALCPRTSAGGKILFFTGTTTPSERARITSGGDFYVGDTNNTLGNTRLYIKGDGTNPASRIWANTSTTSVYGLVVRHESTTAGAYIQFITDSNVETGRIYDLAGTMQYASSSDARLKTNVQPMQNSLQSVLALNPCTFDMRRGEDTFIPSAGLIAQEVHEVYPFVVGVGGDDENTNPWSVDYGKLTPLLVAAIKELNAKVEAQAAEIAALKAQP